MADVHLDHSQKLVVHHVHKTFGTGSRQTFALADVTLEVGEREIVGLIGPSGCGKSTLLHICAGLSTATSGIVEIDGHPVTSPGPDRCVVFQRVALFPHLNARRNVEYGLRLQRMPTHERRNVAREYMKLVELSGFEDAYPHELSGGMQQRVALARALVLRPRLLLMDEPFASLDAQTRILMQELVARLSRELGLTAMLVTHNVEEAVYLANRVFVMSTRPGRISTVVDIPRRLWADDSVIEAEDHEEFAASRHNLSRLVRHEVMAHLAVEQPV